MSLRAEASVPRDECVEARLSGGRIDVVITRVGRRAVVLEKIGARHRLRLFQFVNQLAHRAAQAQILEDELALETGHFGRALLPIRIVEVAIQCSHGARVPGAEILRAKLIEPLVAVDNLAKFHIIAALALPSPTNSRMLPMLTTENSSGRGAMPLMKRKLRSIFHGPSAWARDARRSN